MLEHRLVGIGKAQVAHVNAHRFAPGERVAGGRVLRLVGTRQQLVEATQRTACGVVRILQIKQLLHRTDHEPQVTEHRQHLADRQVGKQHGQHGRRAEDVDAELEQQATGTATGIAFPLRVHGVIAHLAGTQAQAAKEVALAVAGADFLDGIEGFRQRLGKARGAVVFELFQVFDALAQLHGEVDHQRVEQQDQQGQLPVHPDQDGRRAGQGQHGHQEAAQGFADELVEGVQVGDQVGGHRAAAQAFVLFQRNTLEALDQADAQAVDDVLGQPGEQLGLDHVEGQCSQAQAQGERQHQADVAGCYLPAGRQQMVHPLQRGIAMAEQYFVHQQRQQQRNGHTATRRQ
ncbi:hypothetical protein D3C79_597230 [compost metagenome]